MRADGGHDGCERRVHGREAAGEQVPEADHFPPRSGPCCFSEMEEIGEPMAQGRWVFRYKRCRLCGFAVRIILREVPEAALVAELRKTLTSASTRGALG